MSLLKNLNPSRRDSRLRNARAAAPNRRTRIGVEALDQRLLLSTTASIDSWGKLSIVGDSGSNNVVVANLGNSTFAYENQGAAGYSIFGVFNGVTSIDYNAGAGDDSLMNYTGLTAVMTGGPGRDTFNGGWGEDVFTDYDAGDTFNGGAGAYALVDRSKGVLTIKGDQNADNATVYDLGVGKYLLSFNNATVSSVSGFNRIEFDGDAGNDYFNNNTNLPATINGGPGDDLVRGGRGNDVFIGSDGKDVYDNTTWAGGSDVLYRNGCHGMLTGPGSTVGLAGGSFSPEELSAQGSLTVSRSGDYLTFNGPSGAGFRLRGTWTAYSYGGNNYYMTYDQVYLESALGEVPLTPGFTYIAATSSPAADVGTYQYAWWPGMGIDTTDPNSVFHSLADKTGLGIKLDPTGWETGLALGSTVKAMGIDAPVNNAVPYFNFSVSTAAGVTFGGVTVKPGGSAVTVQAVFDPSDPFLFVRVDAELPGNPLEKFALGWSTKGQIPFEPKTSLDGDPELFGNIYAQAEIKLEGYPVKIEGETVIDLDANDDGVMVGLTGSDLARIVTGSLSLSDIQGALSDIKIGVNGTGLVDLSKKNAQGADLIKLSFPVSQASAIYTPYSIAFHAKGADPFKGTPLEGKVNISSFDLQGRYNFRSNVWFVSASSSTAGIGGYSFGQVNFSANSESQIISIDARFAPPMGFNALTLQGSLNYMNGDFSLRGGAQAVNIDAGVTQIYASADFLISNTSGTVRFAAKFHGFFYQQVSVGAVYGSIDANIDLTVGSSGVALSGSGSLVGGVIVNGKDSSLSLGFTVSTSGFDIKLPAGIPGIKVRW